MVLSGVDEEKFYVTDPLNYNTGVPRAQFMKIYRQLGSRAVVLKEKTE
jgi:predicted double-glycine peptidase